TELVPPGRPLRPGQIYDSNGLMLAAALTAAGADIELLPAVADDEAAHRAALERGLAADVLVTSGGVSVGPHDLVRRIEAELGVEEVFWRVAMKPGKPVSFGVRGSTLVFGLPGNPVSSLVASELFVKPALRALQGVREPLPRVATGRLARSLRRNDARDEYVRARSRPDGAATARWRPVRRSAGSGSARRSARSRVRRAPPGRSPRFGTACRRAGRRRRVGRRRGSGASRRSAGGRRGASAARGAASGGRRGRLPGR